MHDFKFLSKVLCLVVVSAWLPSVAGAQGTINNTIIGNTIPQAGTFTTVTTPQSILAAGAQCNGTGDDSGAINAVLAANLVVYIPPGTGTCLVASSINITQSNQVLIGQGINASVIKSSSATLPVIKVAAGLSMVTLEGFTVDRSVAAMAGANGIDFTSGNTINAIVKDVQAQNQWVGFAMGPAAYGQMIGDNAFSNYSDGFQFTNATGPEQTDQWTLLNTSSENNNGWGYEAIPSSGTVMIMLPWVNVESFANASGGAAFGKSGSGSLANININGGVFSTDNGDELYFNNAGNHVQVDGGAFIELAGTAASGRGGSTPATNTGDGIDVTGSVGGITVNDVTISANSNYGILSGAFRTQVIGAKVLQNSQATPSYYSGIDIQNETANSTALVVGTLSGNFNTYSPQATGIAVYNGIGATITGNDVCFNNVSGVAIGHNSTSATVNGNVCAAFESSGAATIAIGATSLTISHGLENVPTSVVVSPNSTGGSGIWADSFNGTTFTVHIPAALTSALNFSWRAAVNNF